MKTVIKPGALYALIAGMGLATSHAVSGCKSSQDRAKNYSAGQKCSGENYSGCFK